MTGVLKLRLIPYNARLLESRKEKGWTQKDLSLMTGLSTSIIGHIETLRIIPSEWAMGELSAAFDKPQEYLFPELLLDALREGLFGYRVAELEEQHVIRMVEARRAGLLPSGISTESEVVEQADLGLLKDWFKEIIDKLESREQKVIKLRFGLTDRGCLDLEQIGREFGVTRERIRQIEAKAIRKLRYLSRKRKLKSFI